MTSNVIFITNLVVFENYLSAFMMEELRVRKAFNTQNSRAAAM